MYATADRGSARGKKSYSWSFASVPAGSQIGDASLKGADSRNPTFIPDIAGTYKLAFKYSIGGQSAEDTVEVLATTSNTPPILTIKPEITWSFKEGILSGPVFLDGSKSYDPDGDDLSISWRVIDTPPLSQRQPNDIFHADRISFGSKLGGSSYYTFFAGCMLVTSLLFIPVAILYKEETYIQDESPEV